MPWTPWRKLAERSVWFEEHPLWFPVCYELALAPPVGDDVTPVYVGSAETEHRLMAELSGGRTPLTPRIEAELRAGRCLFYRAQARETPEAAARLAADLAGRGGYAWNSA